MKRALERIEIPDEHGARERARRLVRAAFAEREPAPPGRPYRPLVALATALAVLAAAASPPGRAVLADVRDAVLPARVERAAPTVTLPTPGRLLVVSAERGGTWIVDADGSRRRIGAYEDATWSPYGRFVVATTRDRLVALEPDGSERWSLVRRRPAWPRWGGTRNDTRIAYVVGSQLRVVAGDGAGDRPLAGGVTAPPAWRPGGRHILAFTAGTDVRVVDVETGRELWRRRRAEPAHTLLWSPDGGRLAALSQVAATLYDARGRLVRRLPLASPAGAAEAGTPLAAAFAPAGDALAVSVRRERGLRRRSEILLVPATPAGSPRQLFAGAGVIGDLAWSPDGRWLLADWRSADQWVFLRMPAVDQVRAVSGVAAQFPREDGGSPVLLLQERWCCAR